MPTTPINRRLPTHELNARRNRKRVLTKLPALAPPPAPNAPQNPRSATSNPQKAT